ncbi:MAG TPA: cation transporter [Polyangiaceae bacterium]|nr:cation transporter [Polyangiaceae bacterium]
MSDCCEKGPCHGDGSPKAPEVGSGAGTGRVERAGLLARGLRLEYLTVGWNVIEGVVALGAAAAAGSVALFGFGVDSFVETASGGVLIWRLRAEQGARDEKAIEQVEHRARKLVALSLFALAAYVAFEAAEALWHRERPAPTAVGLALTALSLVVMRWLAGAKRKVAVALGSRAMEADAFQTTACFWLSIITLAGIGVNALFGWWWADPVAALGMTFLLVKEGREAWEGRDCCG